jgi:hypothetical protein
MFAANFFQHQAGEFPFKGGSAQALGIDVPREPLVHF